MTPKRTPAPFPALRDTIPAPRLDGSEPEWVRVVVSEVQELRAALTTTNEILISHSGELAVHTERMKALTRELKEIRLAQLVQEHRTNVIQDIVEELPRERKVANG